MALGVFVVQRDNEMVWTPFSPQFPIVSVVSRHSGRNNKHGHNARQTTCTRTAVAHEIIVLAKVSTPICVDPCHICHV